MFIFHLLGVTDYLLPQNVCFFFNLVCHVPFSTFFCFVLQKFSIFTMIKGKEIKCENRDFSRFLPVFPVTESVQT